MIYLSTGIPIGLFALLLALFANGDKIYLLGSLSLLSGVLGIGITLISAMVLLVSGNFGANKKKWGSLLLTTATLLIIGLPIIVAKSQSSSLPMTVASPTDPAKAELPVPTVVESKPEPQKQVEKKPKTTITKTEFDQLESGITYEQATEILGVPGEVQSEIGFKGEKFHQVTYKYKGEGSGSLANLTFQANKLTSKMQVGLK